MDIKEAMKQEEQKKKEEGKKQEDKKQDKKQEDKKNVQSLPSILDKFQGAPTQEQRDKWKIEHGEIFVSGFSETELYIWRPLTRQEWIQLQEYAERNRETVNELKFEEMVCDTCMLWKSKHQEWSKGKAGTVSSLHEQILQQSNFLSPQGAAMLVAKL